MCILFQLKNKSISSEKCLDLNSGSSMFYLCDLRKFRYSLKASVSSPISCKW